MQPHQNNEVLEVNAALSEWIGGAFSRLAARIAAHPDGQTARAYAPALAAVDAFEIRSFETSAAFALSGRILELNSGPLLKVLDAVSGDLESEIADRDGRSALHGPVSYAEAVTAVYLLHELRHIGQGMADYETVQSLKSRGLSSVVAEIDLCADFDAIRVFADIYSEEIGGSWTDAFKLGLYFSFKYFLRVFDFSKPIKSLRAASLLITMARCELVDGLDKNSAVPIDAMITFRGIDHAKEENLGQDVVLMANYISCGIYRLGDAQVGDIVSEILVEIAAGDIDRAYYNARLLVGCCE